MGCIPFTENKQKVFSKNDAMKWIDSPVGKITLELKEVFLQKLEDKAEKKQDLILVIKLSDQMERIPLKQLLDEKHPKKLTFAINSCYKYFGRYLSVQVWNIHSGNTIDIGLGIIDLHQEMLTQFKRQQAFSKHINLHINYRETPAGHIKLIANFIPTKYENLTFKVFGAVFRSVLGKSFEHSHCLTKITIGQQVLQTKIVNSQTNYLNWEGEEIHFRLPTFVREGKIHVIDRAGSSDIILGQMILDIPTLLQGSKEKQINQCLDIDEILTGKINMLFSRGNSNSISNFELDSPRKIGRNIKNKVFQIRQQIVKKDSQGSTLRESTTMQSQSDRLDRNRNISLPPVDIKKAMQKLNMKRKKYHQNN